MAVWPNGSSSIPTVTSEFNPARRNPVTGVVQPHNGIDLIGWSTVVAPAAGTIIFAGYNGGAGNEVRIRADNGDVYRLLHNSRFLRTGGRVAQGEGVAIMGTTGQSTGVHCHYETKPGGGTAINPRDYMARNGGGGGGSANVAGGQRTAKTVVNRRADATSQSTNLGDPLQPGTVGNFVGWKHGESVEGNNVWYQGTSGNWFWSGGFHEGANGTGLKNLNPVEPTVSATQRVVGSNTANRRIGAPSTSAPTGEALAPGTTGNFTHWTRGEMVEGNDVWFKGTSGDYFWSGGFVGGANTNGLPEEKREVASTGPKQRRATTDLNGRQDANTSTSIVANLAAGALGDFDSWKNSQDIDGEKRWLRGAHSGAWFSLKFLTPQNVDNLPEFTSVTPPVVQPPTQPVTATNPRGLKEYTPVYSGARYGLEAPLGFNSDGSRASRKVKGVPPNEVKVSGVIDRYIAHWTGVLPDQLEWFSYKNSRSVCPTFFLRPDGTAFEMVRPGAKPAATGPEWNWRSIAVETQMVSGDKPITDAQLEWHAHAIAWLASYGGKELDGAPVRFKIDRTHVIGHREAVATECPGDYFMSKLDWVIARAKVIYSEKYEVKPVDPKPEEPSKDTIEVPKVVLQKWREEIDSYLK